MGGFEWTCLECFQLLVTASWRELAILTFPGKDATAKFDMIHPPDVVEKYAPDAIIGVVGSGKARKAKGSTKSALPVATDKADGVANLEAWGDWRMEALDDTPGVLLVNVRSYVNACNCLILCIIDEICATIFSAKNFKISSDRTGLSRSAVFLIFFIVVHAVGDLHAFKVSVGNLFVCVGFLFFCSSLQRVLSS